MKDVKKLQVDGSQKEVRKIITKKNEPNIEKNFKMPGTADSSARNRAALMETHKMLSKYPIKLTKGSPIKKSRYPINDYSRYNMIQSISKMKRGCMDKVHKNVNTSLQEAQQEMKETLDYILSMNGMNTLDVNKRHEPLKPEPKINPKFATSCKKEAKIQNSSVIEKPKTVGQNIKLVKNSVNVLIKAPKTFPNASHTILSQKPSPIKARKPFSENSLNKETGEKYTSSKIDNSKRQCALNVNNSIRPKTPHKDISLNLSRKTNSNCGLCICDSIYQGKGDNIPEEPQTIRTSSVGELVNKKRSNEARFETQANKVDIEKKMSEKTLMEIELQIEDEIAQMQAEKVNYDTLRVEDRHSIKNDSPEMEIELQKNYKLVISNQLNVISVDDEEIITVPSECKDVHVDVVNVQTQVPSKACLINNTSCESPLESFRRNLILHEKTITKFCTELSSDECEPKLNSRNSTSTISDYEDAISVLSFQAEEESNMVSNREDVFYNSSSHSFMVDDTDNSAQDLPYEKDDSELECLVEQIKSMCEIAQTLSKSACDNINLRDILMRLKFAIINFQKKYKLKSYLIDSIRNSLKLTKDSWIYKFLTKTGKDDKDDVVCNYAEFYRGSSDNTGDSHNFVINDVRRIGSQSILVKWNKPNLINLMGYEVYVNDVLKNRIFNPDRTTAILDLLEDKEIKISTYAITAACRCQTPAAVLYKMV